MLAQIYSCHYVLIVICWWLGGGLGPASLPLLVDRLANCNPNAIDNNKSQLIICVSFSAAIVYLGSY